MPTVEQFIKDNAKWLLVLLFSAGMFYSEMKDMNLVEQNLNQELKIVEERLGKKIKIIQDNEDKIHNLEIRIVKLETKDN